MPRFATPRATSFLLAVPVVLLAACGPDRPAAEPTPATSPAAVDGKAVYETRCSPCHGMGGAGDGPAAAAIEPKPRNFRDPAFWAGRTAEQLRMVVRQGRPGTMMAPFAGILSDREIEAVVGYIETFRRPAS